MTSGREVEHALLDVIVREVAAGAPRAVVVRGAPGAGKSALLRRLRFVAAAEGFAILDAPRTRSLLCLSGPALFAVDDLVEAGAQAVSLVTALLRTPPDGPLLVAASLPAGPLPRRLRRVLRCAERGETLTAIELAAPVGAGWGRTATMGYLHAR